MSMSARPIRSQEAPALPGTLAGFRDFHAGESIIVCGCGTSLANLRSPERFITIGVNDVGRLFQPDYLVVVNSRYQFAPERFRHVEESRARALFTHLDLGVPHPKVVRFKLGRRGGTEPDNPNTLHYTRNSPYVAMSLALHMGARRIGLLGVDFTDDHFFGKTGRHPLARELAQIDAEYKRLYEACQRMAVEVYNLSDTSRLTALPKLSIEEFGRGGPRGRSLRIVSYATTPVAGVPAILARAIAGKTRHDARSVWSRDGYGNGVVFQGDVEYTRAPSQAAELLEAADVVIVHNGKVEPRHQGLLEGKAVLTLAHNYMWNVDPRFVMRGFPGLVVGQYQATLPEFAGWTPVPNPIPLWEPAHQPGEKQAPVTVCYTPSGKHERYPVGHRLYWHSKGYHSTVRVLQRLAQRLPLRLELIRDGQVSHAESLAMKRRSHIVIDECVTGSYHRNSLEGLATGCVVVNGVGRLPGLEDVFRACAGQAAEVPFVSTGLDDLEAALERLIVRGADALVEEGRRNRRWMEAHWDFSQQWSRFWEPAIERALERATEHGGRPTSRAQAPALPAPPAPAPPAPPPAVGSVTEAPRPALADVTIVVPHGGQERLRNLRVTVERLRSSSVAQVVVVESDSEPRAKELVEGAGFRYVFAPLDGPFHKARVMNVGAAFVTTRRLLWLDSDLIFADGFLQAAVAEMDLRRLDCLVPWTSVSYLSEEDSHAVAAGTRAPSTCTPLNTYFTRHGGRGGIVLLDTELVRRHGGMCEEFVGWGGEDNAFFHKASLLGRAAATHRGDQHIHHLYHPRSGGYGPEQAMAANPHYQRNLALLHEVRTYGSRERFLRRFPAPEARRAPWPGVKRLACGAGAAGLGRALVELFGSAVVLVGPDEAPDALLHPVPGVPPDGPPALRDVLDVAARLALPSCPPPLAAIPPKETPVTEDPKLKHAPGRAMGPLRLNLGCCDDIRHGFVNVDRVGGPGVDEVADLSQPWPWPDDAAEHIRAWDIIEHLPDKLLTMNELWRVLRPGGRVDIAVPTTDGPGAFQDPTHVSFWNRRSFLYYEAGNPYRERFARSYGIRAKFRVVHERTESTVDGPRLLITLEAVKP